MAVIEGEKERKGEISRCLPQRVVDPSPYCSNNSGRRRGQRRLWIAADLPPAPTCLPHGKGLGDATLLDRSKSPNGEVLRAKAVVNDAGRRNSIRSSSRHTRNLLNWR
jgi:hypothetical protein